MCGNSGEEPPGLEEPAVQGGGKHYFKTAVSVHLIICYSMVFYFFIFTLDRTSLC